MGLGVGEGRGWAGKFAGREVREGGYARAARCGGARASASAASSFRTAPPYRNLNWLALWPAVSASSRRFSSSALSASVALRCVASLFM